MGKQTFADKCNGNMGEGTMQTGMVTLESGSVHTHWWKTLMQYSRVNAY